MEQRLVCLAVPQLTETREHLERKHRGPAYLSARTVLVARVGTGARPQALLVELAATHTLHQTQSLLTYYSWFLNTCWTVAPQGRVVAKQQTLTTLLAKALVVEQVEVVAALAVLVATAEPEAEH